MTDFPRRADHATVNSYRRVMEAYREERAIAQEAREQPFDGAYIHAWRDRLAMTRQQLAVALGVSTSTVAHWEAGEQAPPPYLRLALSWLAMSDHAAQPPRVG